MSNRAFHRTYPSGILEPSRRRGAGHEQVGAVVLPWPSNIAVWVGAVVFLIPSLFLSVFLMGEAFQWFDKAHWIRITLCTLGNAARETRTHGNVFVLHELDRCDVDTGAKGLDLILNYYVNELSLFVSVPIYSILGMIVFGWLAGKWGNPADEIE